MVSMVVISTTIWTCYKGSIVLTELLKLHRAMVELDSKLSASEKADEADLRSLVQAMLTKKKGERPNMVRLFLCQQNGAVTLHAKQRDRHRD